MQPPHGSMEEKKNNTLPPFSRGNGNDGNGITRSENGNGNGNGSGDGNGSGNENARNSSGHKAFMPLLMFQSEKLVDSFNNGSTQQASTQQRRDNVKEEVQSSVTKGKAEAKAEAKPNENENGERANNFSAVGAVEKNVTHNNNDKLETSYKEQLEGQSNAENLKHAQEEHHLLMRTLHQPSSWYVHQQAEAQLDQGNQDAETQTGVPKGEYVPVQQQQQQPSPLPSQEPRIAPYVYQSSTIRTKIPVALLHNYNRNRKLQSGQGNGGEETNNETETEGGNQGSQHSNNNINRDNTNNTETMWTQPQPQPQPQYYPQGYHAGAGSSSSSSSSNTGIRSSGGGGEAPIQAQHASQYVHGNFPPSHQAPPGGANSNQYLVPRNLADSYPVAPLLQYGQDPNAGIMYAYGGHDNTDFYQRLAYFQQQQLEHAYRLQQAQHAQQAQQAQWAQQASSEGAPQQTFFTPYARNGYPQETSSGEVFSSFSSQADPPLYALGGTAAGGSQLTSSPSRPSPPHQLNYPPSHPHPQPQPHYPPPYLYSQSQYAPPMSAHYQYGSPYTPGTAPPPPSVPTLPSVSASRYMSQVAKSNAKDKGSSNGNALDSSTNANANAVANDMEKRNSATSKNHDNDDEWSPQSKSARGGISRGMSKRRGKGRGRGGTSGAGRNESAVAEQEDVDPRANANAGRTTKSSHGLRSAYSSLSYLSSPPTCQQPVIQHPGQGQKKRGKPKRAKGLPKPARFAWNFFFKENYPKVRREGDLHNVQKAFLALGNELGTRWKQLTQEEKEPYEEMARQDRERYRRELEALERRLENRQAEIFHSTHSTSAQEELRAENLTSMQLVSQEKERMDEKEREKEKVQRKEKGIGTGTGKDTEKDTAGQSEIGRAGVGIGVGVGAGTGTGTDGSEHKSALETNRKRTFAEHQHEQQSGEPHERENGVSANALESHNNAESDDDDDDEDDDTDNIVNGSSAKRARLPSTTTTTTATGAAAGGDGAAAAFTGDDEERAQRGRLFVTKYELTDSRDREDIAADAERLRQDPNSQIDAKITADVLIVDDDENFVLAISHKIHKSNYKSECVSSGDAASQMIVKDKKKYGIVLMDKIMNGDWQDGINAVRRIRESGYEGPIVGVTADDEPNAEQEFSAIGVNETLKKSHETFGTQLLESIRRHRAKAAQ